MNFEITNTQVFGLDKAIKASGNPMRTEIDNGDLTEKDWKRAKVLGTTVNGEGHDNFLKGILVQMDIVAPLFWWKEAQRYHWFDFVSSQSTMHCLLKFDMEKQFVDDVDRSIEPILAALVEAYHAAVGSDAQKKAWRRIVATLPCGFCLGASMTTNYQQLKTMYKQRKHHKLEEWHVFCNWCESLPFFKEIALKE